MSAPTTHRDGANLQDASYRPSAKLSPRHTKDVFVRAPSPSPYPESSATASSSALTSSPSRPRDAPSSSRLLLDPIETPPPAPPPRRRSRKQKPPIELAPDQPPTTQGKPRTRVFVACLQCRTRKIRCDGAKPVCFNCSQRLTADQCDYDSAPKRRGPDRVQGARTRTTKGKDGDGEPPVTPRRRRMTASSGTDAVAQAAGGSFAARRPSSRAQPPESPPPIELHEDPSVEEEQGPIVLVGRRNVLEPSGSNLRFTSTALYDPSLMLDPVLARTSVASDQPGEIPATSSYSVSSYADAVPSAFLDVPDREQDDEDAAELAPEPSLQFSRKVWWDHILRLYSTSLEVLYGSQALTQTQRDVSSRSIVNDMRYLFRTTSYWFSFINVPRFYNNFLDPVRRSKMQPSLVLAALAVSTYLQSSELGRGEEGRRTAMLLRDEAQSFFDASLNSRAVDEELAQAAWILAFFEVCAHPYHKTSRVLSSLQVLDNVIRMLSLTFLDAGNPQASRYSPRSVPSTISSPLPPQVPVYAPDIHYFPNSIPASTPCLYSPVEHLAQAHAEAHYSAVPQALPDPYVVGCTCEALSLGRNWPESHEQAPSWILSPAWNYEWNEGDVRKEECRRLSWSAMMLAAGQNAYASASSTASADLNMFMIEPSNYSILFPGEALMPLQHFNPAVGKETVWALYIRAMLLWHSCLRFRNDGTISEAEKSDFAVRAWLETEAIEKLLARHTCGVERAWMFVGREYLFNTRMCISYDFQRFIPHVLTGLNREKSVEWLREQGKRAKTVMLGLHAVTGNIKSNLAHRPWFVWWFMGQVNRALTLWNLDNTLTIALDVSKAFLEPIEFLTAIYPCSEQRRRYERLRERLRLATLSAEASGLYSSSVDGLRLL